VGAKTAGLPEVHLYFRGGFLVQMWSNTEVDKEWVELIKEAFLMGITKEEVLNFLLNPDAYKNVIT